MALHFNRNYKKNNILSLISIISTISIILGVAVLIISLSAMNGFEYELQKRILGVIPHGEIETINQPFKNWLSILYKIKKIPGIISATPYVQFTGLIEHDMHLCIIQIKGINPQISSPFNTLSQFISNNTWNNFKSNEKQIILGKGIAHSLNVKIGSYVKIMIPNNNFKLKLLKPKYIQLHVTGILNLNGQLDHSLAFIPLNDAQQYLNLDKSITGIAIKVNKIFSINKLLYNISKIINLNVYIKSWINTYGYMYNDIQMIRTIMYLAMILVIFVACFNIVSTLIITVKNKSNDIAILRTMGAENNLIYTIFIIYGLLTGLIGCIIGILLGIITSLKLTVIIKEIEKCIGYKFLSSNIYFIDFLPSKIHILDIIIVFIITLIFSLLASIYPANSACKIHPSYILNKK